ncbi:GNAT family N-acetyltransferase [Actinokineospora inagensis]|uniref:GNAT family N-acetyltransferase n=1 Tax=Actinokineospora inagensis TaxID=103730 RepID=UPI000417B996|nr:GNAT family N-acetyltransferase [Actinokineospora inagensis]
MTDVEVRPLAESELRAALDLFRVALHRTAIPDEQWAAVRRSFEPGRTLGGFVDGTLAGTALSWTSDFVVPGGAVVPMAAVTRVGVRTDFRRRGVLTALMRHQLADAAERGEVLATLRATEPVIYPRFGYGPASTSAKTAVRTRGAGLRPDVPTGGRVRVVDADEALRVLPEIYRRVGRVPGTMGRPEYWWTVFYERAFVAREPVHIAVHSGPDGDDGFAMYRTEPGAAPKMTATVSVEDFVAADPGVVAGLWRFLVGIDLVDEVTVWNRPADEPVAAMLVDSRAATVDIQPDLWARVVDVEAALAARAYGPGSVVVEVVDPLLPANSGRYRVGADGAARADDTAELVVDVDVLPMLYLGAWRVSALAGLGRLREVVAGAAERADSVFAVRRASWSGTYF